MDAAKQKFSFQDFLDKMRQLAAFDLVKSSVQRHAHTPPRNPTQPAEPR